ncbi:hypothetical protein KY359_03985 [Candidatus Woesearchaeota archaeon]|nr:hypothetical protein [Candidatus Woesearchaeota archaeon]
MELITMIGPVTLDESEISEFFDSVSCVDSTISEIERRAAELCSGLTAKADEYVDSVRSALGEGNVCVRQNPFSDLSPRITYGFIEIRGGIDRNVALPALVDYAHSVSGMLQQKELLSRCQQDAYEELDGLVLLEAVAYRGHERARVFVYDSGSVRLRYVDTDFRGAVHEKPRLHTTERSLVVSPAFRQGAAEFADIHGVDVYVLYNPTPRLPWDGNLKEALGILQDLFDESNPSVRDARKRKEITVPEDVLFVPLYSPRGVPMLWSSRPVQDVPAAPLDDLEKAAVKWACNQLVLKRIKGS